MRPVSEIIVHCSATRPEWMARLHLANKIAEIRRWHVYERGWRDIGYHILIDRDGTVGFGRPLSEIGAHTQGHNTGTIGICLIGGFGSTANGRFGDSFTEEQDRALRGQIKDLMAEFGPLRVSGHNQYAAKACPGFNVPSWYAAARAEAALSPKPVDDRKPAAPAVNGFWAWLASLFHRKGKTDDGLR